MHVHLAIFIKQKGEMIMAITLKDFCELSELMLSELKGTPDYAEVLAHLNKVKAGAYPNWQTLLYVQYHQVIERNLNPAFDARKIRDAFADEAKKEVLLQTALRAIAFEKIEKRWREVLVGKEN